MPAPQVINKTFSCYSHHTAMSSKIIAGNKYKEVHKKYTIFLRTCKQSASFSQFLW